MPLPIVHFDNDARGKLIRYAVPYEYMQGSNDCWLCVLKMMARFQKKEFKAKLDDDDERAKTFGQKISDSDESMVKFGYKKCGSLADMSSIEHVYTALRDHGPFITCIDKDEVFSHAIVVTGVTFKHVVFNDPDQRFTDHMDEFENAENILVKRGAPDYVTWKAQHEKQPYGFENPIDKDLGGLLPPSGRSGPQQQDLGPPTIGEKSGLATMPPSRNRSPIMTRASSPQMSRRESFSKPEPVHTGLAEQLNAAFADTSGSVSREDQLAALKQGLSIALPQLQGQDNEQKRRYLDEMQYDVSKPQKYPVFSAFKKMASKRSPEMWIPE